MMPLNSQDLAQPTPQQLRIVSTLRAEYGLEDKLVICLIEGTGGGIVRMDWCEQKRHLFIKPDGTRLAWDVLSTGGINAGQMERLDGR